MDGYEPNDSSHDDKFEPESHVETAVNFRGSVLRSVSMDNKLWFVAKDICEALDLADPTTMLRKLQPYERGSASIQTAQGPRSMAVVNESGLYMLMFNSTKPEAIEFRLWVSDEVLPSLRRGATGERQASGLGSVYVRLDHPGFYRTIYESNGMLSTVEIDDSCLATEVESAEGEAVALAAMLVATLWRNHRLLDQVRAFNQFSNNRFQIDEAIQQANHLAGTLIRNRRIRRNISDDPER